MVIHHNMTLIDIPNTSEIRDAINKLVIYFNGRVEQLAVSLIIQTHEDSELIETAKPVLLGILEYRSCHGNIYIIITGCHNNIIQTVNVIVHETDEI